MLSSHHFAENKLCTKNPSQKCMALSAIDARYMPAISETASSYNMLNIGLLFHKNQGRCLSLLVMEGRLWNLDQ